MDSLQFQTWTEQPSCFKLAYHDTETCSQLSNTVGPHTPLRNVEYIHEIN